MEIELLGTGNLGGFNAIRQAIRIRRRSFQFDIVHAQYGSVCGWLASLASSLRVVSLRGTDVFGVEVGRACERLHGTLGRWFTLRSLKRFHAVITMSEQMSQRISPYGSDLAVSVIPSGIDLTAFSPMSRELAMSKLGVAADPRPWVLVAGVRSNNPVKRLALAEQSVDLVREMIGDVQLKFVSGVSHEEMPYWVNASSAILVTSTHEGWPNIVKEALACNVPFVSTDVGDLRTIASRTSNCFVADADPASIAGKLACSLRRPRSNELRALVKDMGIEIIARRHLELYQRLAKARSVVRCGLKEGSVSS